MGGQIEGKFDAFAVWGLPTEFSGNAMGAREVAWVPERDWEDASPVDVLSSLWRGSGGSVVWRVVCNELLWSSPPS